MPRNKYEWWDLCKGLLLLITLVGCGAGFGYWYKDSQQDADHMRELERQARGYQAALDVLAGRIGQTADKVADAAGVAADAAQAAQEAAGTADKAASVASKAASTAGRAADKAGSPVVVMQPQQPSKAEARAINQAVQQENTQIKGQK